MVADQYHDFDPFRNHEYQFKVRHRSAKGGGPLIMTHHHFPKSHCSNDDVILSNYHHHSFRSLPTYVWLDCRNTPYAAICMAVWSIVSGDVLK